MALAAAAADKGGPGGEGITKYVAPRVLLWFRWASVATWLTGAWYLGRSANFAGAFMLGMGGESVNLYQLVIGIGAWLGTSRSVENCAQGRSDAQDESALAT